MNPNPPQNTQLNNFVDSVTLRSSSSFKNCIFVRVRTPSVPRSSTEFNVEMVLFIVHIVIKSI